MSKDDLSLSHLLKTLKDLDASSDYYSDMMLNYIDRETETLLNKNSKFFETNEWAKRSRYVRRNLLKSLGLDPLPNRTPLNSKTVGVLEKDDYIIEKVVFESRPGFDIPAHLYLPKKNKNNKIPAVLYSVGHWMENGKMETAVQACCIGLVKLGIAVLVYDPIGQGERGCSFKAHGHKDLLLLGLSQAGFMVWESMRAIDYLLTRGEIDGNHIGMTGASGGGLNTFYTSAIDNRISISVPVCYVTTFDRFLKAMRGENWNGGIDLCNQVPDVIRIGGMAAVGALMYPRPMMLIGATFDPQFSIEGTREIFEKINRVYGILAEERLKLVEINSDHGYNQLMREASYGWFSYWLLGNETPEKIREPKINVQDPEDLKLMCFNKPLNNEEVEGILFEFTKKQLANIKLDEDNEINNTSLLLNNLDDKIHRIFTEKLPEIGEAYVNKKTKIDNNLWTIEKFELKTEPNIFIPLIKIENKKVKLSNNNSAHVYLSDNGKLYEIESLISRNRYLFSFDVRGTGDTLVPAPKVQTIATIDGKLKKVESKPGNNLEFEVATNSLIIGKSLLSQQIYDFRVILKWIQKNTGLPIIITARGIRSTLISLISSCFEDNIKELDIIDLLVSFKSLIGKEAKVSIGCYQFGILKELDIPQLLVLSKANNLKIESVINGEGERISSDNFKDCNKWVYTFLGRKDFKDKIRVFFS